MIVIQHVSSTVFQENTYIIKNNNFALIIDPGDDPEKITARIEKENCKVQGILATHGHVDHILAAFRLCEVYSCPFIMSTLDSKGLDELKNMCVQFQLPYYGTPKIDINIASNDMLELGDFSFNILHTPGHTKGSVCYLFDHILFSGDTLFHHSIGRTDLFGGDMQALQRSIKDKLLSLPDDTRIYPGHLEMTTIKEEKYHNPFIVL
ncbi:MAG: MBL fold metallo-hydrolase [Candidatus Marinimicrobia bacterium]|nr:MBL fold metallo-hydrolase [Candidatus Neomarinimicrobiota bacterium]